MLRWDPLEEVRVSCAAGTATPLSQACAHIDACTLPLVVHDYQRAAVLGTATLMLAGGRPLLLTAAHLFDAGVRFGNLMAPLAAGHGFVPLMGAGLAVRRDVDIAVLDLRAVPGVDALLKGRSPPNAPLFAGHRRRARRGRGTAEATRRVLVSGYPAALTRFERGWLAARRFTLLTRRRDDAAPLRGREDRLFDYGHVASRGDGVDVHTPCLEGMSGAGIWVLEREDAGARLRLDAVQSAYLHGGYLRGYDVGAAMELFRA
jgi:hypothetical protein